MTTENNNYMKNRRYDIFMNIWGLLLGPIEIVAMCFIRIHISSLKPYQNSLITLIILAICFKIITCVIQYQLKEKIKNKNTVFYLSSLSIIISWFTFYLVGGLDDPNTEDPIFTAVTITFLFTIIQHLIILPLKSIFRDVF